MRSVPREAQRLHDALLETLQLGIDHEGASIESFVDPAGERGAFQEILNVYGRVGEPCRQCGGPSSGSSWAAAARISARPASRCRAAGGWPPAAGRRSRAGREAQRHAGGGGATAAAGGAAGGRRRSVVKATLTVALLQIEAAGYDQDENLRRGAAACRQAAALGADIALFPEMWNIGYWFEPARGSARARPP